MENNNLELYEYLSIYCEECFDENNGNALFKVYEQPDDNIYLMCERCGHKIFFNDVEASKIWFVDWLHENHSDIYFKYAKLFSQYILKKYNLE